MGSVLKRCSPLTFPTPYPSPKGEGLSARATLANATEALFPVSDTPRLDAELLMAHSFGFSRDELLMRHLDAETPSAFATLLARRLNHEPLAYIIGSRDFWTITLKVAPSVLIPRADSETLIEAAVDHFGAEGPARVLDLGTGSGALLLAALAQWPVARGLGVDASDAALTIASENAKALGLAARATFQKGDWTQGLSLADCPSSEAWDSPRGTVSEPRFDLILCNPPYVETTSTLSPEVMNEPHSALFAGVDGLDDYRRIIPQLPALIAPEGLIAMEIGYTQAQVVSALFAQSGMMTSCRKDLGGRDRAIVHFALGFTDQLA